MKSLMLCMIALLVGAAFAEDVKESASNDGKKTTMSAAEKRERFLKMTGGRILKPQSGLGSFGFVNAQTNVPMSELVYMAKLINRDTMLETKVFACGDKMNVGLLKKLGIQMGVSVVCDKDEPTLIVAPEEGWAVVNVAKLGEGADGKMMYSKRVRKELYRAFGMVTGACGSSYDGNLLDPIREPSDLDMYPESDLALPYDMLQKIPKFCKPYGLRPWVMTTYRHACIDGWAPAPTNDYQRAVWDQVHEAPTKPLVIAPETKREAK